MKNKQTIIDIQSIAKQILGVSASAPGAGSGNATETTREARGVVTPAVMVCSCSRSYSLAEWACLPFAGIQRVGDGGPDVEIRGCCCGSHRGRDVSPAEGREIEKRESAKKARVA